MMEFHVYFHSMVKVMTKARRCFINVLRTIRQANGVLQRSTKIALILTGIGAVVVYLLTRTDNKVLLECAHDPQESKYFFENMQYQIVMDQDIEMSWFDYKDHCDSQNMTHGINIKDVEVFKDKYSKETAQGEQMWAKIRDRKFWLGDMKER